MFVPPSVSVCLCLSVCLSMTCVFITGRIYFTAAVFETCISCVVFGELRKTLVEDYSIESLRPLVAGQSIFHCEARFWTANNILSHNFPLEILTHNCILRHCVKSRYLRSGNFYKISLVIFLPKDDVKIILKPPETFAQFPNMGTFERYMYLYWRQC